MISVTNRILPEHAQNGNPDWLTIAQAAALLPTDEENLRGLIEEGTICVDLREIDGELQFTRESLERNRNLIPTTEEVDYWRECYYIPITAANAVPALGIDFYPGKHGEVKVHRQPCVQAGYVAHILDDDGSEKFARVHQAGEESASVLGLVLGTMYDLQGQGC